MSSLPVLGYDAHNVLFNDQPYPLSSIRLRYPVVAGDNTAAMYFPWWTSNALWSGDVRTLINGDTGLPFVDFADFQNFCNLHLYTPGVPPAMHFLGAWDASTNTPTLTNGDPNPPGDFYITSVAGTVDFGAGPITFAVNDLVVYNGSIWQNGGAVVGMDLQAVTSVGNTTNTGMRFMDGSGNILAAVVTPGGASLSVIEVASADGSTGIGIATMPDNSLNEIDIFNGGGDVAVRADVLTASRVQQLQDADGTIALEETMTLQKATDAGNTTTNEIDFVDGSGNTLAVLGMNLTGTIVLGTLSAAGDVAVGLGTKPDGSLNEVGFVNTGGSLSLRADVLTGMRQVQLPDKDGTIALTTDLTSTVNVQTGTAYTFVIGDQDNIVTCNNASPVTVTVPPASSVAFPIGTRIEVIQLGAGKVSFTPGASVTIFSQSGYLSVSDQYVGVALFKVAPNTWVLNGSLSV